MKRLGFLAVGLAVLVMTFTGCAKLPDEINSMGDLSLMAASAGSTSGAGANMTGAQSIRSFVAGGGGLGTSDSDGWFTMTVSSGVNTGTFKQRFYCSCSTATPLTGDFLTAVFSHIGPPVNTGGHNGHFARIDFAMTGTGPAGDFTMNMTLTGIEEWIAPGPPPPPTPSMSGTMTVTTAANETATMTYTGLVTSPAAGTITGGTVTGTNGVYTVSLTYGADGSSTGTISENGAEVADITVDADGQAGTITYKGKAYDITAVSN